MEVVLEIAACAAKQNKEFLEVSPAVKLGLFTSEQGLGSPHNGVFLNQLSIFCAMSSRTRFAGEGSASHAVAVKKFATDRPKLFKAFEADPSLRSR